MAINEDFVSLLKIDLAPDVFNCYRIFWIYGNFSGEPLGKFCSCYYNETFIKQLVVIGYLVTKNFLPTFILYLLAFYSSEENFELQDLLHSVLVK